MAILIHLAHFHRIFHYTAFFVPAKILLDIARLKRPGTSSKVIK